MSSWRNFLQCCSHKTSVSARQTTPQCPNNKSNQHPNIPFIAKFVLQNNKAFLNPWFGQWPGWLSKGIGLNVWHIYTIPTSVTKSLQLGLKFNLVLYHTSRIKQKHTRMWNWLSKYSKCISIQEHPGSEFKPKSSKTIWLFSQFKKWTCRIRWFNIGSLFDTIN